MSVKDGRRDALLDGAVRHAADHGLAGLTLRPLAAALGTSDRMLIYHFGTREKLLVAILDRAFDRLAQVIGDGAGDSPGDVVHSLWAGLRSPAAAVPVRLYLEAAARAAGDERWRSLLAPATGAYLATTADRLTAAGLRESGSALAARVVSATLDGLLLQVQVDRDESAAAAAVAALARWVDILAGTGAPAPVPDQPAGRLDERGDRSRA